MTHRSKRRLFGLKHLAPLGEAVRPPYRPMPGRGRPLVPLETEDVPLPPMSPPPPIERRDFDYSDLEQAIAQLELTTRQTRRSLDRLVVTPASGALAN